MAEKVGFFTICGSHKGILVHVRWIQSMEKDTILLETKETLPLARRRVETVRAVWKNFQEKCA